MRANFQLIHKVTHGFVDLQISNLANKVNKLSKLFSDLYIEIVTAGKSAAFRKRIQKINIYTPFENQETIASSAFQEATNLLSITTDIWNRLPGSRTVE